MIAVLQGGPHSHEHFKIQPGFDTLFVQSRPAKAAVYADTGNHTDLGENRIYLYQGHDYEQINGLFQARQTRPS